MRGSPLWLPLFFGAGLATGLAHFQVPVLVGLGLVVLAAYRLCEEPPQAATKQSPSIHRESPHAATKQSPSIHRGARLCEEPPQAATKQSPAVRAGPSTPRHPMEVASSAAARPPRNDGSHRLEKKIASSAAARPPRNTNALVGWYTALFLVGIPLGLLSHRLALQSCAALLPVATIEVTARLREPIPNAGGMVRMQLLGIECRDDLKVRLKQIEGDSASSDLIAAGTTLRLRGTWIPDTLLLERPSGLLVAQSARVLPSRLTLSDRFRTWLSRTIETLYGSRAPLVDALVTGRRADMDRELKDAFAASGLVHLLSISGFHVGVIAAWLTMILRACGISRVRSLFLAAFVSTAYVGFLGWPAPALRAAALAWVIAWLRLRDRATVPDAALALTALLVLVFTPVAIVDLGAWLSVLALWGATRATRWCDAELLVEEKESSRPTGTVARHLGTLALRTTAASIGATVATAPITAGALGAVAPIGILLNLAAIPLAALAVPAVFASLLMAPLMPPLSRSLAAGGGLGLHLIERLAMLGAQVPGGHLVVPAEPRSALPWLGALVALVWITRRHTTRSVALTRVLAATAVGLWFALLAHARIPNEDGRLALHFLDVGQGDAAVIRTPRGHVVVVDAGPRSRAGEAGGSDAGARVVVPFLRRARISQVDVLVASHGHLDHVGGAAALLQQMKVGTVVEPAAPVGDPAYFDFIAAIMRAGVPWDPAQTGESFEADGVRFRVLHPTPGWKDWGLDVNDDSVVLLVEYGAFRAVFAGDAGFATEAEIRRRIGRVDLLKVGHHGSRSSSGDAWLEELKPRIGIISVGRNKYGHPAPAALARLRAHNVEVWRTDEQGNITVLTDGRDIEVRGRRRSARYSAGGS